MTKLTYKDSDNVTREIDCNLTIDKQGKYWIYSNKLKHNLVYKSATYENALLASIASLLFTIELKDRELTELRRIEALAVAFADQIKPDDLEAQAFWDSYR